MGATEESAQTPAMCIFFRHRQGRAQAIGALYLQHSAAQHGRWMDAMHRTSTFTHQLGPHLDIGRHTTSLGRYSDDYLHERSYDRHQSSLL